MSSGEFAANGWTAVARSQAKIVEELKSKRGGNLKPASIRVEDVNVPDSDVAKKVHEYAKRELPTKTFNHSMRVWYYGKSFQLFPYIAMGRITCIWRKKRRRIWNLVQTSLCHVLNGFQRGMAITFIANSHRCRHRQRPFPRMDAIPRNILLDLPAPRHWHH